MEKKTLGLLGLGLVGTALTKRFIANGFNVCGYDVDADAMDRCVEQGLQSCHSPREVAERAHRIVLSLPNSAIVNNVVEGKNGLLSAAQKGGLIVDTTTADPVACAELAARLRDGNIRFVDATILGSSQQIADGDALVMAGGHTEDFAACDDIFATFARRAFHMGDSSKGAETKLIVNLVLGLHRLVLAEGLVLGERAGVDLGILLEVLKEGAAYSRAMDSKGEKMIQEDFTPQARLAQHLKDVDLILELGERTKAPLPLSDLHAQLLRSGVDLGLGAEDNSAIIKVLRRMAATL